jgi:hypothetical protein
MIRTPAYKNLDKIRGKGKLAIHDYLAVLYDAIDRKITGVDFRRIAERVFSKFLLDLHFGRVHVASDDNSTFDVFKREMQKLLRETGTPGDYYLLKG